MEIEEIFEQNGWWRFEPETNADLGVKYGGSQVWSWWLRLDGQKCLIFKKRLHEINSYDREQSNLVHMFVHSLYKKHV